MDRNVGACTRRQEGIYARSLYTSHGRSHYGGCRNPGSDRTAPSGPALLKPEAFLGVTGLHSITHGTQWSIFFNSGLFVLGSIYFRRGEEERRMADSFVDILVPKRGIASLASLSPRITDLPDKKQIIEKYLRRFIAPSQSDEIIAPADQVVIAVGWKPRDDLKDTLKARGIRHYIVGDAAQVRRIIEATDEGAKAAWDLQDA